MGDRHLTLLDAIKILESLTFRNFKQIIPQVSNRLPFNHLSCRCPITAERLSGTDGYEEFEGRRRDKFTKIIAGGIAPAKGLDEGVDRKLMSHNEP